MGPGMNRPGMPPGGPPGGMMMMGPNGPMGPNMGPGPNGPMGPMGPMHMSSPSSQPCSVPMGPSSHPGQMGPGGPMGPSPLPMPNEKTYPPNQPMIFNPANPNAPPIYPCRICHKEVHENDQALLCESGCNFWFHRICTGIEENAFMMLTAEIFAEWVCDGCFQSKDVPLVKFKP